MSPLTHEGLAGVSVALRLTSRTKHTGICVGSSEYVLSQLMAFCFSSSSCCSKRFSRSPVWLTISAGQLHLCCPPQGHPTLFYLFSTSSGFLRILTEVALLISSMRSRVTVVSGRPPAGITPLGFEPFSPEKPATIWYPEPMMARTLPAGSFSMVWFCAGFARTALIPTDLHREGASWWYRVPALVPDTRWKVRGEFIVLWQWWLVVCSVEWLFPANSCKLLWWLSWLVGKVGCVVLIYPLQTNENQILSTMESLSWFF